MARRYTFICDGCDLSIQSTSGKLPGSWADCRIHLTGFATWPSGFSRELDFSRLLCPTCQHLAQRRADPDDWPRTAEEAT